MIRVRVRFTGHVQGVGFRATVQALAATTPVTGWVRNRFDGSVEAELQGLPEDVEALVRRIRLDRARYVRGCEITPISTIAESESSFRIVATE